MKDLNLHGGRRCRSLGTLRRFTLFLIALFAAGHATATLPTGEEIMMKKIEALGGEAALARHHNCLMKGTMSISGIQMDATIYTAEPNLQYILFDSEMIGKMESGCNGKVAWDLSVMQGASVKEREELETALFDAAFNPELHWRDRFTSIDVQAVEEINGKPCYKAVLTPKLGEPVTTHIDIETGLTLKTATVINSAMGSVSVVSDLSDYREVDGVKVPFTTRVLLMGAQEMITTLDSVEFNVDIPERTFDLPTEIRDLFGADSTIAED